MTNEKTEDRLIINSVLKGNVQAYEELVNRYSSMVFTIASRIAKNKEDSEEVTQDVFIKAFRSLDKFSGRSKFSTWLYRIAYNEAISKQRKQKTQQSTSMEETEISTSEISETKNAVNSLNTQDRKKCIENALNKLDEDEAAIINLYYLEEEKVADIVKITGLKRSNVKVKLFREEKTLFEYEQ
ncbi:MAG: RNA polymerase sigma factor [Flavobacteriales bacterium]